MSLSDEEWESIQKDVLHKTDNWFEYVTQRELLRQKLMHDESKDFLREVKFIKEHADKGIDDFIKHM